MLTFEDAGRMLAQRATKKLARNTYLRMEGGDMVIRFWETDIVRITLENNYTLNTGGYLTTTTKDRLSRFTPARVGADRGLWYVYEGQGWDNRKLFANGIRVDITGKVIDGAGEESFPAIMKKVDRLVTRYIAGYAAHVMELGYPDEDTAGDCWGCKLHDVANPENIEPMGYDHYLSHFHENYYVPSILTIVWGMMKADIARGYEPHDLKQSLRKFFRSRKLGIAKALAAGWTPRQPW